jgi:hypothetical protein
VWKQLPPPRSKKLAAEIDPELPLQAANYCIARGSFALMLVALLIGKHFSILGLLKGAKRLGVSVVQISLQSPFGPIA